MFRQLQVAVLLSICALATGWGAEGEEKLRPFDGSSGYSVFAGTTSPDGAWALAYAQSGLKPAEAKTLKPWAADLELPGNGDMSFDNYLFDVRGKRLAGVLSDFDFYNGHGWRKNRAELYVAWMPDSRHALAICEERWDDAAIVWLDAAEGKFPSVKEPMEKAYAAWLRGHEKHPIIADMHFQDPVAVGADVVVMDAWSQPPKDSVFAHYLLKIRFTPGKGDTVQCTILAGVRIPREQSMDDLHLESEKTLQVIYDQLRAKLSPKAREALKAEEVAWLKTRDALPPEERSSTTAQRSALLRARLEFP